MKVLITGGAGFIGSHLADLHVARGDEVWIVDDLSSGSLVNIDRHVKAGSVKFLAGDASNTELISDAAEGAERLYHLASVVGVKTVMEHRIRTLEVITGGTHAALAAASKHNCQLFLASTSEVYGNRTIMPLRETDQLWIGPSEIDRWGYAASKLYDEFLAIAYARELGVKAVVGRLFNTIGPRQVGRYGMVVPRFASAALLGQPIQIYGGGNQTRSFTQVTEVCRAIDALLSTDQSIGKVFNIGGSEEISINSLAGLVMQCVGRTVPVHHVQAQTVYGDSFEDIDRRVPDCSRLRDLLGWAPSIPVEVAVKSVCEWMKDVAGAEQAIASSEAV